MSEENPSPHYQNLARAKLTETITRFKKFVKTLEEQKAALVQIAESEIKKYQEYREKD